MALTTLLVRRIVVMTTVVPIVVPVRRQDARCSSMDRVRQRCGPVSWRRPCGRLRSAAALTDVVVQSASSQHYRALVQPDKSEGTVLLNLDPARPSTVLLPARASLTWRSAQVSDGPAIAELRALALRASLERLGRYDEMRVRERFLTAFVPSHTLVLQRSTEPVGSIAVRPSVDGTWIEHFYLHPAYQGRGLGSLVMDALTSAADAGAITLRLNVLQYSEARRLYERHGFLLDHEDQVDVYLLRLPIRR